MEIHGIKARLIASSAGNRFEILAIAVGPWHPSKKGPTGRPIYSTEASLQASVSAFDGIPVAAYELKPGFHDHLPDSVFQAINENGITFLKNKVGRLYNPRFGATEKGEKGIIVNFDVTDPNIAETVQASINSNHPDFDGFSIDGDANWTVEKIDGVEYDVPWITRNKTLDMVKYPAAGGKPLRLAASHSMEGNPMKLTAQQRATIIAVLMAAGVGDEILNNLMACAPDAFINKGRELLAKEREFLKKFDDTLAKFERGEEVKIEEKGTGEPVPDAKAKADAEAKKAADEAEAKKKADDSAKAEAEAKAKAEAKPGENKADVVEDPAVKKANEILENAQKLATQAETALGEATVEKEVTASHLPDVTKKQLSDRLKASRTYDITKIRAEVDKEAKYLKTLLGDNLVPGLRVTGSIEQMQSESDKLILAMQGAIRGQDIKDAKGVIVPRLRSWREINSRITGSRWDEPLDRVFRKLQKLSTGIGMEAGELLDLQTGRLTASTIMSTDLASMFLVAIHNEFITGYVSPSTYDNWRKIAKIVDLKDLYAHNYTRMGLYSASSSIAEGGTYPECETTPSDEHVTLTAVKYGQIYSLTDKDIINDRLDGVQRLRNMMVDGEKRGIALDVFNIILNNSAVAYGSDTDTLVHSNHSNGAASGGADLVDSSSLEGAWAAMIAQTEYGTGAVLGELNRPKYLLVHAQRMQKALKLTMGERAVQAASSDASEFWSAIPSGGMLPDSGAMNTMKSYGIEPLLIPNATTAANWWTVADPNTTPAPAVMVGFLNGQEQPEVVSEAANSGSHFTADKIRIKVKNYRDAEPGDHRGIYGQIA